MIINTPALTKPYVCNTCLFNHTTRFLQYAYIHDFLYAYTDYVHPYVYIENVHLYVYIDNVHLHVYIDSVHLYVYIHNVHLYFYIHNVLLYAYIHNVHPHLHLQCPAGTAFWQSTGLVIERLRVRIPAETAREFSSPELTLCADSYLVSIQTPCYRSGT